MSAVVTAVIFPLDATQHRKHVIVWFPFVSLSPSILPCLYLTVLERQAFAVFPLLPFLLFCPVPLSLRPCQVSFIWEAFFSEGKYFS